MKLSFPTIPRVVCLLPFVLALAPLSAAGAITEKNQKTLAEALALFNKGAYSQALEKAESIRLDNKETRAAVYFFLANTHAKMQAFDKASEFYQKTLDAGSTAQSLHYDYGQALFAQQKLKEAESEFRKSLAVDFKVGASAYYIAYIRSVFDDKASAREFYTRITKLQHDPDKVKQSSLLQLAELAYDEAQDMKDDPKKRVERKRLLEREVQRLYRRARDYDPNTPVADQARARLIEIEAQIEAMAPRMRNGNPLPIQRYTLLLSQDLTYDSNVITQADEALIQVSNNDALIWKTGLIAKYQFQAAYTFSFIPELASAITYHSRRKIGRAHV